MLPFLQKLFAESEKTKKQMMLLVGLASLVIVVLYVNFICIPQFMDFFATLQKGSALKTELSQTEDAVSKITTLRSDLDKYRNKVSDCEKMLPAQQEIPSLLEDLSAMAKSSNVKIVGITPMLPKEDKTQKDRIYQEIPIVINAKSGYHELGRFIHNLENSDRFMKVADIEIKANRTTPKKHDVELLVLTYVLLAYK